MMKISSNTKTLSFTTIFLSTLLLNPSMFLDKVSFCLSLLSSIFLLISLICTKMVEMYYKNFKSMKAVFMIMMMILISSFYFSSMFLFYIFFEMSVIPIFLFILSWGTSKSKIIASYYLFFFTFFSSILFLVSLMILHSMTGSFNFSIISYENSNMSNIALMFLLTVFFVKMPMFFFHIWLPLAHVESPMLGSMILASIMLKLGGYGIYRMMMMFFMKINMMKMYFFSWGIWGSIVAASMSISQVDMKKMIAYSSVSHMSIILSSIMSMSSWGKSGTILMMLSHGLVSSLMFYGLGVIYYRLNSRSIMVLNSSTLIAPSFGLWWFLIIIMNLGFPPFISFFSELFVLLSMIIMKSEFFIMGMILIIFSSIYSINMMMFLISGLSKKMSLFPEIKLIEHLLMANKFFLLISSTLFIWMF